MCTYVHVMCVNTSTFVYIFMPSYWKYCLAPELNRRPAALKDVHTKDKVWVLPFISWITETPSQKARTSA